jgi:hypothetical protein
MVENLQSVFNKYFGISGLERLITTNFTDIEWSMFLEQNFEINEPKRTRDHYQHQFRNAFLGCTLLYDFKFIDNIIKCIEDKETIFSFLVNRAVDKYMIKNHSMSERIDYEKEITFKAFLLAAIFHDIGYPIEYYLRESRQIHKFTPFYKIINSNIKADFAEIKAILVDSQLFSLLNNNEIEEKYNRNDHGVFSAISFLLNFYQAGSIFSMSDIDRCVIEMAAIAIYNHTNKYKDDERMVFNNDPISFLLRLCDDLQEWSRFSLSINNTSNMLRCKCFGMLKRTNVEDIGDSEIIYKCQSCGQEFYKVTSLEYKKIHYLSLCDEMEISWDGFKINININYDAYKQLELLLCDYTAVKYRDNDLKKIKEMLKFQKNLPDIKINWFLSNNPCELARRVLGFSEGQFITEDMLLKKIVIEVKKENPKLLNEFITEINKPDEYGNRRIETDSIKFCERSQNFVIKYIGLIKAFRDNE